MNKLLKLSKNVCTVYIIRIQIFVKTWSCRNAYLFLYSVRKRTFLKYNRGDIIREIIGISVFFFIQKYLKIEYFKWKSKLTFSGEKFSQHFSSAHFVFRLKCEIFQELNRRIRCLTGRIPKHKKSFKFIYLFTYTINIGTSYIHTYIHI